MSNPAHFNLLINELVPRLKRFSLWLGSVAFCTLLLACNDSNNKTSGESTNNPPENTDGEKTQCVLAETDVEVMTTEFGVEFVRTPEACFADLKDFPYEGQYVEIDGLRQAYVEDGPSDGPVVLLLHGQPSWSYLYRKMIPVLAEAGYRVIAMDHLGTGRSDKPIDVNDYTYLGHTERLEAFIEALQLQEINLFVQDWGSLIGLRFAGLNPDLFASIAVGNGTLPVVPEGAQPFPEIENPNEILELDAPYAAVPDQQIPFYEGCDLLFEQEDNSNFGVWMNYAMKGVSFKASETLEAHTWFDLPAEEEAAYDAPFPSRIYMAGIRKFPSIVNDLPGLNDQAMAGLMAYEKPFITIWASNDPGGLGSCETQQFFIDNVPGATGQAHARLPEASHFLQDDQGPAIAERLLAFYEKNNQPEQSKIGYEILQILSPSEIVVWLSTDLTQQDFDAIELPMGWIKNQPREGDPDAGQFANSPGKAVGEYTEAEHFGHSWRHVATITDPNVTLDDAGLLAGRLIAKSHEISFFEGSKLYVIVSPGGDQYVRVSRDAGRTSDEAVIPEGWRFVEYTAPEPLTLQLPNPTLNIRTGNEDSFQGPIGPLDLGIEPSGGTASPSSAAPIALGPDLCEDPALLSQLGGALSSGNNPSYGSFNAEQAQRMLMAPTDGPFYMVNLIRFREQAEYADGRETTLTGREANELYSPTEYLAAIGARPVFVGDVTDIIEGVHPSQMAGEWDSVAIVQYPCPLAFFAMSVHEGFNARAIHKDAGVESSIVMVTYPEMLDATSNPVSQQMNDMTAFNQVQVFRFHDVAMYANGVDEPNRSGREAMEHYASAIKEAEQSLGIKASARLNVQGVLIGDGRSWDAVWINSVPSDTAFDNLLAEPAVIAAEYHREAALAETYALKVGATPLTNGGLPFSPIPFGAGSRYCELLLIKRSGFSVEAEVWGTQGLNDCPQEQFEGLNLEAIQAEFGALRAVRNGPRIWLPNVTSAAQEERNTLSFGGLAMSRLATVDIDPSQASEQLSAPYRESIVRRTTTYSYPSGSDVFELVSPGGGVYVMQSMSLEVDASQALEGLPTLGQRLNLPAGWTYQVRQLDEEMILKAEGEAIVLTDDFRNTYQKR